MSDLGQALSSASATMAGMVAEATEQLLAAYYVETGTSGAGTITEERGGRTWVTMKPGDLPLPDLPAGYMSRRAAEYAARTSLPASSAAVVYGFDGLTFHVEFRPSSP